MNERTYKKIIVVLGLVCAVSVGISIYLARPGRPAETTGTELIGAVDHSGDILEEQRVTIDQLRDDLAGARTATEAAMERSGELESRIDRAGVIAERSDVVIGELRGAMGATGGTIKEVTERQRRINELALRLIEDYQRVKMELGGGAR
jgi:ABC-type transporter Mla subunit MlaD